MDPTQPNSQAAEQQWLEPPTPSQHDKFLELRIEELEQQVAAYDALLNELPDLFKRKFQERLAPILATKSPDNVVRFPGIKLMSFLRPRRRSA